MKLETAPKFFRAHIAKGIEDRVDTEGGTGYGIISGAAIVTRGEALGHGVWLDAEFLQSVADQINGSKTGLKSRFTHPGLSGDGTGKFLGRVRNAFVDGDVVRGDIVFSKTAHDTPEGNLASYVMQLAIDDPESFGTSIVFLHDADAEFEFVSDNTFDDAFLSPDERNLDNLPHARLSKLRAVDVVDDPAANPSGMFSSRFEAIEEGERLLSFALGLTNDRPVVSHFAIDPDRLSGFVKRFLGRHGLELKRKVEQMTEQQIDETVDLEESTDETTDETLETETVDEEVSEEEQPADETAEVDEPVVAEPVAALDARAECREFIETFGAELGARWFADGVSFEDAKTLLIEEQQSEIERLNQTIAAFDAGEEAPLSFSRPENSELTEYDKRREQYRARGLNSLQSSIAASIKQN